jgi:hypothetical protein
MPQAPGILEFQVHLLGSHPFAQHITYQRTPNRKVTGIASLSCQECSEWSAPGNFLVSQLLEL